MKSIIHLELNTKLIIFLQILVALVFCLLPLMLKLPYRANIYLTWEGAYRLYLGQMPYKDFGMPIGVGFWIMPLIFFKLFGPTFLSILKSQVLLNLLSLISIRVILKKLGLTEGLILLVLFLNGISFVLLNFWPWYNHTVFVYQIVSIAIITAFYFQDKALYKYMLVFLAGFMVVLSFFTKQDGGGFAIIVGGALVLLDAFVNSKKAHYVILYSVSVLLFIGSYILMFKAYDLGYWFNHGQEPHYSRVNLWDLISQFFQGSQWIKFYLAVVIVVLFKKWWQSNEFSKSFIYLTSLSVLILGQVIIIQVTSFSPPFGTHYYHTFGIAFILSQLKFNLNKLIPLTLIGVLIFFWYSENYWNYSSRIFIKLLPKSLTQKESDVVSIGNWAPSDTTQRVAINWVSTDLKTMKNITLPEDCYKGIKRIMDLEVVKDKGSELKVLNMSELTFLAYEMNYKPYADSGMPLFYHKGVCVFDREITFLCDKINQEEFDLILFAKMNYVKDYYPFQVRECAADIYQKVDEFIGPTGYGSDGSPIEVYVRKPLEIEAVSTSEAAIN